MREIKRVEGKDLWYVGEDLERGVLPAVIYLSLSGYESLALAPYNAPLAYFEGAPCRLFSFTLPCHGQEEDKFHAMQAWAEKMKEGEKVVETFVLACCRTIDALIADKKIDGTKIAIAGLSRGAFLATHIAAKEKRISHLLGYAPLTTLTELEEFQGIPCSHLDLHHLTESLTHLQGIRFYIGNRDTRVGTDAAYTFIRNMTETAFEKRVRSCLVELRVTPSIGHKGHGTAPETFAEGALWLKTKL